MADNWPTGLSIPPSTSSSRSRPPPANTITYTFVETSVYGTYTGTSTFEVRSSVDNYATSLETRTTPFITGFGYHFYADVQRAGHPLGHGHLPLLYLQQHGRHAGLARAARQRSGRLRPAHPRRRELDPARIRRP
jgi:hypothetical protein